MPLRTTHTYAILEVDPVTFNMIREKLQLAGYDHAMHQSAEGWLIPNDRGNPPGKLADAEIHFAGGPLNGLKLIGFSVWQRRSGGSLNITFPARQYNVNGERRSFALLRPIVDATSQQRLADAILDAWATFQATVAAAEAV